ncbi:MAG: hypothetical protein O2979_03275 [Proteobacteria bacterium]|nr:hypothetical protein [Pseudomonadota bacterium]
MSDVRACPGCGYVLRFEDDPGSFSVRRHLGVELLLWAVIVLFLATLWAPPDISELYAALALATLVAWLVLRKRQRAEARALLGRRRYHCAQCGQKYLGRDLPPAAP